MPANPSDPQPLAAAPLAASQALPSGAALARTARWQVRLLGTIEARAGARHLSQFPSRAAVQLLARLALKPDRMHPREELVELLWPGVDLDVGRNRLRQALSVLKSLLEAGDEGPVIQADRHAVRAAPGALACDAVDFERQMRAGAWDDADALYRGELLPGFYEEWVAEERGRLAAMAEKLQTMPRVPPSRPKPTGAGSAAAPGQLPAFWTRLFGTEINASRLRELVRHQRLVTVFGAGGSGKTRLAVEAARALAEPEAWAPAGGADAPRFGQVVFVSLVDCSDAARALDAIATALRVQGRDLLQGIASALAGPHSLLLLDNYEQLAGQAEELVQRLLTDTATLHLMVTSRQRLNIDGEQVFELAGLPLPGTPDRPHAGEPAAAPHSGEEAPAGQAAMALFMDRARAAAADFQADAQQERAVAELVRLLAGMPLAIELAASRMRGLTPTELLALLTSGQTAMLDLLARNSGGHSMAQRHASLRHVVAWSWQQLSPDLMVLMQALACFAAPASNAGVAALAQLDTTTAGDRLAQLRDHSLLFTQRDANGVQRYSLLQPVREFVIEKTPKAAAAELRERLRKWLISFARQQVARGHASIDDIEAELPQVYAVILDAAAVGPAAALDAVTLATTLRRHWEIDTRAGLPLAVTAALQAALPAATDTGLRCQACVLLAFSRSLAGDSVQALALSNEAVALATTDPQLRAYALLRHAHVVMFSAADQTTIDGPLAEAVQLAQQMGDQEAQALALRMQFLVAVNRDDDRERGEALALQVQQLWESVGHRRNAYSGLMDRASCWLGAGRLDEAAMALAACEQAALQERHATGHIMSSWQLGRACLKLRRADEALAAFRRCLQGSWQHKRLAYVADALVQLPGGLAFTGQVEDAARLMGFASAHWQRQFGSFYKDLERDIRPTRRWLRQRLGAVRFEALRLQGLGLQLPQAVALGLGQAERP